MLNHGGQLQRAQIQYPNAPRPWLDLSTGIAPWSWPVPSIPMEVWQRLPEEDHDLLLAAKRYYQCPNADLLAVSGSQVAIEKIPTLIPAADVAVPLWGYAEHQKAWRAAGHHLHFYRNADELSEWIDAGRVQHVVVINPNNPSADVIAVSQLKFWQQQLHKLQGVLVIDEAFADSLSCQKSMAPQLNGESTPNLIVLRSVGKFFGLAGLRLGFVLAAQPFIEQLKAVLPLWGVTHPAQWLGQRLLIDTQWHQQQRRRIEQTATALHNLLRENLSPTMASQLRVGPLFVSLFGERSSLYYLHQKMAEQGILIRFFEAQQGQAGLRFGLPDKQGLIRLEAALRSQKSRSIELLLD